MIDEKDIKKMIVLGSILLLLALAIILLWPIMLSIFGGFILAFMLYPLYKRVFRVVREKNISALIIVLLLILIIFIPLWFLFPIASRQLLEAYNYVQNVDILAGLKGILPDMVSKDSSMLVSSFISKASSVIFSQLSNILTNLTDILLQAVIVLFVFFFAMRDADKLKAYLKGISPFSSELEESLAKHFKDITNSVVYGHIIVGILQGILTGIGLFIFGVPHALLLTAFAVFAAVLPVVGAWLVWIPASIYLLTSGHVGAGIGLALFGGIIVSWIDNVLRPYIVSRKSNLNSGLVLVGMLGGLIVFGVLGLIIGPLILAYLIVLLDAYKDKKLAKFFKE
jgi:predicted PurR-regulated permease PerM